jgi:O-antigen/teichoic acid export membrane protein
MSRIRRAAVAASFAYAQYGVAIASGILLVPLTLHRVGAVGWGLWLASGELLGHAGMVELGVLGVLPWMLAEADGRRDRVTMRHLVGNGVAVATLVGGLYLAIASVGWLFLPRVLHLTPAELAMLAGPLLILVVANAVSYPLRVMQGVLSGLQDVYFNGAFAVLNAVTGVAVTSVLLVKGYALYALAIGAAVPAVVCQIAALVRVLFLAPDLLKGWTRPTITTVKPLFTNGAGVWLGTVGWALLAATNGIVMMYLGHPEWVAIYAVTAKLSTMSTQIAWVLPDSGLIGLAQLYGEHRDPSRLRSVVMMILRLHLLLAGGAVCGFLAFNPAFVSRWVGAAFFGGLPLNALLAAGIVAASLIHGLITTASVLGNRLKVGAITLVNGVTQAVMAVALGHFWGLGGVAFAVLLAGAVTAVPAGILVLRPSTELTVRHLMADVVGPWFIRFTPLVALATVAGLFFRSLGMVSSGVIAAAISLMYLWHMRPFYAGLPFDARWSHWLVRLRLITPVDSPAVAPAAVIALDQVTSEEPEAVMP